MTDSADSGPDEKEVTVVRNATDLQRLKLEKLMKNPEKLAFIPDRPREKKFSDPAEFVRNVMGSSAGAGSGEFHVYRHIRRREYARQEYLHKTKEKDSLDRDYHEKIVQNKLDVEEKAAKKRAKRQKQKERQKAKRLKLKEMKKKGIPTEKSSSSEESSEEEDEDSEKKGEKECSPIEENHAKIGTNNGSEEKQSIMKSDNEGKQ
ncbi:PRKR-interacting protein 1 [Halocaridina rubra]|uniref:PRKR-interacting protein 1 n=1 Tax=Halocaridina rubra TaxID=373956 RepID=A0AAN8WWZ5_HALRR